jgi:asparagine synthase (glutamine-hydrolysing)
MSAVAPDLGPLPLGLRPSEDTPWRRLSGRGVTVHARGFLRRGGEQALLRTLEGATAEAARQAIAALDGRFALLVETPSWSLAAVDRIASIPLFVAEDGDGLATVSDDALSLSANTQHDLSAALMLAMGGYTIGPRTLDPALRRLQPGEIVGGTPGQALQYERYALYRPWLAKPVDRQKALRELEDVSVSLLDDLIEDASGRPILVPLSAGLDSRFIASGLRWRGYRDVFCYAYGLAGNHEAEASRQIAEALEYPWRFVPYSHLQQADTFASEDGRAYLRYADTLSNIPFQQDLHAVRVLKDSGFAPEDALFVNGQSGDYISGNHIPAPLAESRQRLFKAIIGKHFSLWDALNTPAALAHIEAALEQDLAAMDAPREAPEAALYEASEFNNRQCKYTIAGQRIYELFGFDWRMPLWDDAYLDFWQGMPLKHKLGQNLYKAMLEAADWGGVWQRGWHVNRKTIVPAWLNLVRNAAKFAHAPLGRQRWHAFDNRYIAWHVDTLANYAVAPYGRVARDRRGHRNAISWHAEAYLAGKGLALDAGLAAA